MTYHQTDFDTDMTKVPYKPINQSPTPIKKLYFLIKFDFSLQHFQYGKVLWAVLGRSCQSFASFIQRIPYL